MKMLIIREDKRVSLKQALFAKRFSFVSVIFLALLISLCMPFMSEAKELSQVKLNTHEIMIGVKTDTIALPGGNRGKNISKVAPKYARIRSTELRELNKEFNAIFVERVYELVDVLGKTRGVKVQGSALTTKAGKSAERAKKSSLKKRIKQQTEEFAEKYNVSQVKDYFILTFSDYIDEEDKLVKIDIKKAVKAYKKLSVVVVAEKYVEK